MTGIRCERDGKAQTIVVNNSDLVFLQNGSMTEASSLGSMSLAPGKLTKVESGGWALWEKLAEGRPEFGNPSAFNSCIAQSSSESFTVTLKNPAFFDLMHQFSGNEAGTGGLVTFKDSNGLIVHRSCPPASLCQPESRRTGVLGLFATPRPHRKLRRQADDRMQRCSNSAGTLRSSALRP